MSNLDQQNLDSDLRKFRHAGYDNKKPRRLNHLDASYDWIQPLGELGQLVYLFMNSHDHDQCFAHIDTGKLRQITTACMRTMNTSTNLIPTFNSKDTNGKKQMIAFCRDYILRQVQEVDAQQNGMKCD